MIRTKDHHTATQYSAKHIYIRYLLQYTILFSIISIAVFCWLYIYKVSFCWNTDTSSQYIPKAYYFITQTKEFLRSLLNGDPEFKMYDFHIGFGDAVPLHLEPLYWLFLLFPESKIEIAYAALILIRFYCAGLSASVLMMYFQFGHWESLLGSMCYVFSGYGLYAGMRHSHFIIPMIMLPLLLISMEEIYRKQRWYLCTVFVAISILCGYYFTYMSTLIMGVYFLIRYFFGDREKSIVDFLLRMRTIICSYLLGLGIGNITFFNTFAAYLGSSRTGVQEEQRIELWTYGEDWISSLYQAFLSTEFSPGSWLWLGFIPLSYLCVILLLIRKGNKTLKAALISCIVCCLIPAIGLVFSGFGSINNRWCYAFALLIAVITAKMLPELVRITRREGIILAVSILPYIYQGLGKYLLGQEYRESVRISSILLIITLLLVYLLTSWKQCPHKLQRAFLTVNVVALLFASGTYRFAGQYFAGMANEFTPRNKVLRQASNTPLKVLDEENSEEDFFRSYSRVSGSDVQGASQILGYNGIVYYTSTLNKVLIDFYREMGLTSWSLVRLRGFEARGFLESLACVRYQVINDKNEYHVPYGYTWLYDEETKKDTYHVYENQNTLPIGYCYQSVMSVDEFEKLEIPYRQEAMLQTAIVDHVKESDAPVTVTTEDVTLTGTKVPISKIEYKGDVTFDGSTIQVNEKNSVITFYFDGLDNCETYLDLHGLSMDNAKKVWFYINSEYEPYNISYCYHGDKNTYNTNQEAYLFHLGYSETGKTYCTLRIGKACTLNVDEISVYCQPMSMLDDYIADRKADSMTDVVISANRVTGLLTASQDELLVLSIPYQNGWTAYVDGVKTELRKVNLMYMGLDVTEGTHEIELRFTLPGLKISLVISTASLVIFLISLILRKKRKQQS